MPRSSIAALIVLLLSAAVGGQKIDYYKVARDTIEQRLKAVPLKNTNRELTLKELFVQAGCSGDHLTEQAVQGSRLPNVICVLPGSSDATIIVGAHFDVAELGTGAVDNWSGASLLPSLYQSVASQSRSHSFLFIGFTDEEKGEIGSRYYAGHLSREQKSRIAAMVNMDTLGLGPTEVWASHADPKLVQAIAGVAQAMHLPLTGMNVEQLGSSDSEPFREKKIPAITIHSVTQSTWHILHSNDDKLSAMKLDDYYQMYQLLAAYLAYLDTR